MSHLVPKMACFSIYILRSDTDVLYIGVSANVPNRLVQHATTKDWWHEVRSVEIVPLGEHPARPMHIEQEYMERLRPIHNEHQAWKAAEVSEDPCHYARFCGKQATTVQVNTNGIYRKRVIVCDDHVNRRWKTIARINDQVGAA